MDIKDSNTWFRNALFSSQMYDIMDTVAKVTCLHIVTCYIAWPQQISTYYTIKDRQI